MRIVKHVAAVFLSFALITGFTAGFGTVLQTAGGAAEVYAAGNGYGYTVKIYSGKEGYFDGDKTKHVKVISDLDYGTQYSIDVSELGLTLEDPDKYYVRGIKLAGHDNDESEYKTYQSGTFTATEDTSYAVAYGIAGGMVKYTVNYVDEGGKELHASQTFYGMAGDKPVVSYKYIEGYIPNAYNLGKTLTENESQNVFTFTYSKTAVTVINDETGETAAETETDQQDEADEDATDDDGDDEGNGGTANNNNGAGTAGVYVQRGADNTDLLTPPEYVDLDEGETPTAESPDQDEESEDNKADDSEGISKPVIIGVGALLVAAIAAIVVALLKRRDEEDDDDEEDDEEEIG